MSIKHKKQNIKNFLLFRLLFLHVMVIKIAFSNLSHRKIASYVKNEE